MNPVEEFLKVAISRERIDAAIDEAQRRAGDARMHRRRVAKSGQSGMGAARSAEAKAAERVTRLERAYEKRLRGAGVMGSRGAQFKTDKPFKPGGEPYTFAKTRGEHKARMKAQKKAKFRKKVEARSAMRSRSHMEGRGGLRQRRATAPPGASPKPPPSAAPRPSASASKPVSGAVAQAAKKGRNWGRIGRRLGAAGGAAALGYGAYRLLSGRKKEKTATITGFMDEFDKIRG